MTRVASCGSIPNMAASFAPARRPMVSWSSRNIRVHVNAARTAPSLSISDFSMLILLSFAMRASSLSRSVLATWKLVISVPCFSAGCGDGSGGGVAGLGAADCTAFAIFDDGCKFAKAARASSTSIKPSASFVRIPRFTRSCMACRLTPNSRASPDSVGF